MHRHHQPPAVPQHRAYSGLCRYHLRRHHRQRWRSHLRGSQFQRGWKGVDHQDHQRPCDVWLDVCYCSIIPLYILGHIIRSNRLSELYVYCRIEDLYNLPLRNRSFTHYNPTPPPTSQLLAQPTLRSHQSTPARSHTHLPPSQPQW